MEQIGKPSAPCIIKAYADADSEEVALIQSNLTARELTYYEKMLAVVRLEEALRRMKENGVELPGRLRTSSCGTTLRRSAMRSRLPCRRQ